MVSAAYLVLLLHVLIIRGTLGQSSGDLRLYPTSYYSSGGRLEMYYSYSYGWTPFTIAGFDMHDADLACKQLGYSYASRYAKVATLGYSQASTSYSISRGGCSSSASYFSYCTISRTYSYSYHSNDVGLQCTNSRSSLKLVSSSGYSYGVSSGRLEIYVNHTWGTVCDDNFYSTEASVACSQLGFSSYSRYSSADSTYGYASTFGGPIWLDNLNCNYGSTDLRSCTNAVGVHNCNHGEDIILTCYRGYTTPYYYSTTQYTTDYYTSYISSGSLRLISYGYTNRSRSYGRLEVYKYYSSSYNWTTFCYSGFSRHAANLACKQLGFTRASQYGRVGTFGYDQGSGSRSITSVNCPSWASSLRSCSYSSSYSSSYSCSHYNDVGITCTYDSSVSPGLIIGLVVGSVVLCSVLFVGGAMCAVVLGVVYRKKKIRSPRTTMVQRQPQSASEIGTYRMSDLEARDNEPAPNVFRPVSSVRYTPSPFTPVTLQHDVHPQIGNLTKPEVENSVAEIKIEDNTNDSYTSDDEKPLIV